MHQLALIMALAACASAAITQLPSTPSTYSANGAATLSQISYSYAYTVTTATTSWTAPTFAAGVPSSPFPLCSETMCPSLNGQRCVDSLGDIYGVLCDVRFSGIVITTSGKKMMMEKAKMRHRRFADSEVGSVQDEGSSLIDGSKGDDGDGDGDDARLELVKRSYAGTFDACAMFCGAYNRTLCRGIGYEGGYCMAYDKITGSFNAPGAIAALRQ